jgi:hypothetical protein
MASGHEVGETAPEVVVATHASAEIHGEVVAGTLASEVAEETPVSSEADSSLESQST